MDDLTVLVHTSTPQYDMLHVLSTPRTGWVMSQRQVNELGEEEASLRGVGTGPWEIVEAKTGEFWKFEAVDGHWRKTPNFAELIFWEIPEKSTRVANFQVGRLDAMNMNLESLPSIQRVAGVKFMRVEAGSSVHLGIYGNWYVGVGTPEQRPGYDPDLPWVSGDPDPRSVEWRVAVKVRQALALSIDHEAIVDALLEDEGKPLGLWGWQANEHRLPPDIRQWPYDPDKAKQLLAEAGYPNGFEIILAPALIGSPGEEACEFVAEMWGGV